MNNKTKGYILGTIAAATYGMNPLFALPLYNDGMNPESVLFFRYLFAIPILAIMIRARGRSFKVNRKETLTLIIMGLLVAVSSLTLFQSYNFMEAGIASTILFVYPIMVAVIMALVFKEKISLQTALCMALALGGIALLYKGPDGATLSLIGTVLALASALTYAIYIVGINQTTLRNTATLTVTFYVLDWSRADHSLPLVHVGQHPGALHLPHSHILPLHHQRDTVYRLHTHCHPGCPGAGDSHIFRHYRLRRTDDGP